MKKAIRKRPDLKLIITSATLDIKKFADYFDAPMVKIPGKMFPVRINFLPEKVPIGFNKTQAAIPLWTRVKKIEQFVEVNLIRTLCWIFKLKFFFLSQCPGF